MLAELAGQAIAEARCRVRPILHMRYDGTDTALPVGFEHGSIVEAKKAFEAAHKAQFGFVYDDKPVVVEAVALEGHDSGARGLARATPPSTSRAAVASEVRKIFPRAPGAGGVFRRAKDEAGPHGCQASASSSKPPDNVVEPGWQAEISARTTC